MTHCHPELGHEFKRWLLSSALRLPANFRVNQAIWVVVKIMVPFWIPIVKQKGTRILTTTHMVEGGLGEEQLFGPAWGCFNLDLASSHPSVQLNGLGLFGMVG